MCSKLFSGTHWLTCNTDLIYNYLLGALNEPQKWLIKATQEHWLYLVLIINTSHNALSNNL